MKNIPQILLSLLVLTAAGCIQVKTESEIKPIHITMDVNLKVDKELDKAFASDDQAKSKGDLSVVKSLFERQVAGVTRTALLEAREGASDDDRIAIAEQNAIFLKRFRDIAKSSGTTIDAVQKRRAQKVRERIPTGAWYQADDGAWMQKK